MLSYIEIELFNNWENREIELLENPSNICFILNAFVSLLILITLSDFYLKWVSILSIMLTILNQVIWIIFWIVGAKAVEPFCFYMFYVFYIQNCPVFKIAWSHVVLDICRLAHLCSLVRFSTLRSYLDIYIIWNGIKINSFSFHCHVSIHKSYSFQYSFILQLFRCINISLGKLDFNAWHKTIILHINMIIWLYESVFGSLSNNMIVSSTHHNNYGTYKKGHEESLRN